jgi:hypothetical protein
MSADTQTQTQDKWAKRFAFFEAHGAPNTPGFKDAFNKLPPKEQMVIRANFIAFFGPFYLAYLGLYKKTVVFLAIIVPLFLVLNLIALTFGFMFGGGFFFLLNMTMISPAVNYAYYLKKVKNEENWNPYSGLLGK